MTTPATRTATALHPSLTELALEAAIELERLKGGAENPLSSLRGLAAALSEQVTDQTLVPVYYNALSMAGELDSISVHELHQRLLDLASKMNKTDQTAEDDLTHLRDFCVGLHDALLNYRMDNLPLPTTGDVRLG